MRTRSRYVWAVAADLAGLPVLALTASSATLRPKDVDVQVYERGVDVFKFPVAFEVWNTYLTKFVHRYVRAARKDVLLRRPWTVLTTSFPPPPEKIRGSCGGGGAAALQRGQKLERARDLFEQALAGCPAELSKPLYLMYAKLEEDYGLAKSAMRIYDRATRNVAPEDRYELYLLYITKVAETYGVTHTREIYERAIEALPDDVRGQTCGVGGPHHVVADHP